MFVVLTGNPNVGKTEIINHLSEKGYLTYKVDDYVNEIYEHGRIGYNLILQAFGNKYVNEKSVNKQLLGELILKDKEAKYKLRNLIWPLIKKQLLLLKRNYRDLIVEMAIFKIDENYFGNIFDFVIEVKSNHQFKNKKHKYIHLFKGHHINHVDFEINNHWTKEYAFYVADQIFSIIYQ